MLSPMTAPAIATRITAARLAFPREAMTPPRMIAISPGNTNPTKADASRAGTANTTTSRTQPCRSRIQPTSENASACGVTARHPAISTAPPPDLLEFEDAVVQDEVRALDPASRRACPARFGVRRV